MAVRRCEINLVEACKVADQKSVHTPIIKLNNIAIEDGRKFVRCKTEPLGDRLRSCFKFRSQVCVFIKARQHALQRAATFHGVNSTRPMPVFQLRTGS